MGKRARKSPAAATHETGAWRVRDNQLLGKVEIDKRENALNTILYNVVDNKSKIDKFLESDKMNNNNNNVNNNNLSNDEELINKSLEEEHVFEKKKENENEKEQNKDNINNKEKGETDSVNYDFDDGDNIIDIDYDKI